MKWSAADFYVNVKPENPSRPPGRASRTATGTCACSSIHRAGDVDDGREHGHGRWTITEVIDGGEQDEGDGGVGREVLFWREGSHPPGRLPHGGEAFREGHPVAAENVGDEHRRLRNVSLQVREWARGRQVHHR